LKPLLFVCLLLSVINRGFLIKKINLKTLTGPSFQNIYFLNLSFDLWIVFVNDIFMFFFWDSMFWGKRLCHQLLLFFFVWIHTMILITNLICQKKNQIIN